MPFSKRNNSEGLTLDAVQTTLLWQSLDAMSQSMLDTSLRMPGAPLGDVIGTRMRAHRIRHAVTSGDCTPGHEAALLAELAHAVQAGQAALESHVTGSEAGLQTIGTDILPDLRRAGDPRSTVLTPVRVLAGGEGWHLAARLDEYRARVVLVLCGCDADVVFGQADATVVDDYTVDWAWNEFDSEMRRFLSRPPKGAGVTHALDVWLEEMMSPEFVDFLTVWAEGLRNTCLSNAAYAFQAESCI